MTTHRSKRLDQEPAVGTPPRGFDRRGVSAAVGGNSTALLLFLAFASTVLVSVFTLGNVVPDDLAEEPVRTLLNPLFLIPAGLLAAAALLSSRQARVRLDVEGGAVVWTWSLLVPYRSRREPFDVSTVREVRLRSESRVLRSLPTEHGAPTSSVAVKYIASLEGVSPTKAFGSFDYDWVRSVAEHFALGLRVPLRLSEDDVRAPEEIYAPLRDRLAQRLLPASAPLPAGAGRLSADYDAEEGTTRIVLPRAGVSTVIVVDSIAIFIALAIVASILMAALGILGWPVPTVCAGVFAIAVVVAGFRARTSAVVTVLADGGLEIVRRFPIAWRTQRIAGDELDDISVLEGPTEPLDHLKADGWRRKLEFGFGLDASERRWLERSLHLAIARRSALV